MPADRPVSGARVKHHPAPLSNLLKDLRSYVLMMLKQSEFIPVAVLALTEPVSRSRVFRRAVQNRPMIALRTE